MEPTTNQSDQCGQWRTRISAPTQDKKRINAWDVPLEGFDVKKAKEEKHLLGVIRDSLIMKKKIVQ